MTFKFHINNTHDVVFSCWAARGGGVGRQSGVRKSSLWAGKPPPYALFTCGKNLTVSRRTQLMMDANTDKSRMHVEVGESNMHYILFVYF